MYSIKDECNGEINMDHYIGVWHLFMGGGGGTHVLPILPGSRNHAHIPASPENLAFFPLAAEIEYYYVQYLSLVHDLLQVISEKMFRQGGGGGGGGQFPLASRLIRLWIPT